MPPGHEALGPHLRALATARALGLGFASLSSIPGPEPALPLAGALFITPQPPVANLASYCLFAWLPEYLACSSRERSNFTPFFFFLSGYLLHFYPIHTGNSWEQGLCGFPISLHPPLPTQCLLTGRKYLPSEWMDEESSLPLHSFIVWHRLRLSETQRGICRH